jgi:hypothetical protein
MEALPKLHFPGSIFFRNPEVEALSKPLLGNIFLHNSEMEALSRLFFSGSIFF